MNFKKVNNLTGWLVFALASVVYIITREATSSLWDCGEFIASAFKVQMPHPPGAPVFVLLGRLFVVLFSGGEAANAASSVNLLSAIASAFTILFLFWTITHFARKMMITVHEEPNSNQLITIMGAGIVGALAYTFSDSFWYSAVEGEVYALSSFFTALVFWAMLKWEHASDKAVDATAKFQADKWIIFIFFMMGLSIGVHLLNLLTIPAIVMIYYFKRYKFTMKGAIAAFIIGCLITGVVQVAVIQYSIKLAGKFDILFVNNFNLPFFSGFIVFFLILALLVVFGIRLAKKKDWPFLRLGLWCFVFIMMGYSAYVTPLVRSNANPAIDMNNVDNPMSLTYYLSREQYGSAPILYGPHFQAAYKYGSNGYVVLKDGEMKYVKGKDKYIEIGREQEPEYEDADMQLFPRVWDRSNDQGHATFYAQWLNLGQNRDPQSGQVTGFEAPTYGDNVNWFMTYQMGFMYWRYFMWNFAGKQNDTQGFGNVRDGNWVSGFSFIDNARLGDQDKLPESAKNNKAHNNLFFLPFLLGILGCVYQFYKTKKDWVVTFLLFFFTGIAVVLYLNQPGNQPRERDYAYVGSFYAFAIWIGLAVVAFTALARDIKNKMQFQNILMYGSILTFFITLMSGIYGSGAFLSAIFTTIIYAAFVTAISFIIHAVSSSGKNEKIISISATVLCLIVPLFMATQEWDDHDRSQKTVARDMAINYLESCAPNAIIFTYGDNDTYPLWYAQEVEGVRPDIRIINNSLLGIDWYINQLRYKINESAPIDVIWSADQIQGHKREYLRYQASGSADRYYDLYDVMKNVVGAGDNVNSFPVKKFSIPVDSALVKSNGTVTANDIILSQLNFELPADRNDLTRGDLMILNIIAANHWNRPIYFTSSQSNLGLDNYLRKDGISFRLVPISNNTGYNTDWMMDKMLTKFKFGGTQLAGTYFDEENRRHLNNIRMSFAELASVLADKGRKEEAKTILRTYVENTKETVFAYGMSSRYNSQNQASLIFLEACYKAGDEELANKIKTSLKKDLNQQTRYFTYLKTSNQALFSSMEYEEESNNRLLQLFDMIDKKYQPGTALPVVPVLPKVDSGK